MNTTHDKESGMLRFEFDGVDDLMRTATAYRREDAPLAVKGAAKEFDTCFTRKSSWNCQHTLADVERELLEPTPRMADVIGTGESLFSSEEWVAEKPRRKIRRRLEDGDEIDVERWREREQDMWEEKRKTKGRRFGVKVCVNIATSAHIREQGFKWRTSTVVAIARIVEELNIPCEIIGCEQVRRSVHSPSGHVYRSKLTLPIKRQEQPLDVDLVGYCLGSCSFFRNAVLGSRVMAAAQYMDCAGWRCDEGLGVPDAWTDAAPNEFVVDRGCMTEAYAKGEVARFMDWLNAIRRKAKINFDGLDSVEV